MGPLISIHSGFLSIVILLYFFNAPAFASPNSTQLSSQIARYDSITTEGDYLSMLREADEATFQREFEAEFLLLLDNDQREQFSRLTLLEERKAYIEKYWKVSNPNPLLPLNDRLLNHLQRRAYARQNFSTLSPPYFDDRGKYYIKYGKPHFRYQDFGGERSMEGLVSIPFKYYSVIPNESWSYVNVWPNYVVHFMQKNDGYKEIESLKEVILDSQRRGRMVWYWSDLMKRRFWMSSQVSNTVNDIEQLEIEMAVANGGRPLIRDIGTSSNKISDEIFRNLERVEYEMTLASADVPPSAYDPIAAKNKIPVTPLVCQFRGANGRTRLEIALFAPLKHFLNRKIPIHLSNIHSEFSVLLSNQHHDSLTTQTATRAFPASAAVAAGLSNLVGHITVYIPPQPVVMAYQVKNVNNQKIGFGQQEMGLRDFRDHRLMLSDIQLLTPIPNDTLSQVLPKIEKQGLPFAPYPHSTIKKSLPLFCYFEIYHLTPQESDYEITYRVYRDKKREGPLKKVAKKLTGAKDESISITNQRQFTSEAAEELIQLDLQNLATGPYKLEINVRSAKPTGESVVVEQEITVED